MEAAAALPMTTHGASLPQRVAILAADAIKLGAQAREAVAERDAQRAYAERAVAVMQAWKTEAESSRLGGGGGGGFAPALTFDLSSVGINGKAVGGEGSGLSGLRRESNTPIPPPPPELSAAVSPDRPNPEPLPPRATFAPSPPPRARFEGSALFSRTAALLPGLTVTPDGEFDVTLTPSIERGTVPLFPSGAEPEPEPEPEPSSSAGEQRRVRIETYYEGDEGGAAEDAAGSRRPSVTPPPPPVALRRLSLSHALGSRQAAALRAQALAPGRGLLPRVGGARVSSDSDSSADLERITIAESDSPAPTEHLVALRAF